MEVLFPFLMIFGFLAFAGAMLYWSHLSSKRRTEAFKEEAEQMGLQFVDNPDGQIYEHFSSFKLFNLGRARRMSNLVEGDSGDVKISIFDYRFTTGSGKNSSTHNQTIIALQSSQLSCPDFTMRPEGFFDKIGSVMGFQDLNFDSHPEFSKLFVLKGPDENAIRSFFTPTVLEFFENHPKDSLEARDDMMFFYRNRTRREPEELKDLLSQAYEAFGVLTEANAEGTKPGLMKIWCLRSNVPGLDLTASTMLVAFISPTLGLENVQLLRSKIENP